MPLDVEAKLLSSHGHLAKKRVEMLRRKRARQVRENARRLEACVDAFLRGPLFSRRQARKGGELACRGAEDAGKSCQGTCTLGAQAGSQ